MTLIEDEDEDDEDEPILLVVSPGALSDAKVIFEDMGFHIITESMPSPGYRYHLIVIATRIVNLQFEKRLEMSLHPQGAIINLVW